MSVICIDLGEDPRDHYPPVPDPEMIDPIRLWLSKNITMACSPVSPSHEACAGAMFSSAEDSVRPCLCTCHLPSDIY